jgi:hypothetical protein
MMTIQPMQWAALPDLQDAPPIDDADLACLHELRDVLARHGKLERFAVHLVHRHFDLGEGEVLIERPDPDGRTQHVTVGRLDDEPDARPTTWLFAKEGEWPKTPSGDPTPPPGWPRQPDPNPTPVAPNAVYCVCVSSPQSYGGCIKHGKSPSPGEAAIKEDRVKQERIQREEGEVRNKPVAGHHWTRRRSLRDGDV